MKIYSAPRAPSIDEIARAAICNEELTARCLARDYMMFADMENEPPPDVDEGSLTLVVAAGLAELFADRRGAEPPEWTSSVAGLPDTYYLVFSSEPELRDLGESPEPLKKRNICAPRDFLRVTA